MAYKKKNKKRGKNHLFWQIDVIHDVGGKNLKHRKQFERIYKNIEVACQPI